MKSHERNRLIYIYGIDLFQKEGDNHLIEMIVNV